MKLSGRVTTPSAVTPYPSEAPGNWRTFVVCVLLIAAFLSAWAMSPTGTGLAPGAPALHGFPSGSSHAVREARVLGEGHSPMGSESVFNETQAADDL